MSVVCNISWLSKEPLAYMPRRCQTGLCACVGPCVNFGDIINHWYKVRSCNISLLLSSLPSTYITCLQCLQNWAARLVFEVDRKQSPKPLLKSLHWLPIRQKISFKLFCLYINVFITKDIST